ncbi:radical SAM family heme chaperone HemW [Formicincola oecophyllae]|nr:radical SAM family heme chaperone HemW [Formicincola oecophyllae]
MALYVHWPFCLSKCPYCDFNSHVRRNQDVQSYAQALLDELRHEVGRLYKPDGQRPHLRSVYFGGGTPSLMPPESVAALIEETKALFTWAPDIEITLEANPTSSEAERFAAFRQAGVNRLSLGVQSLDDAQLKFLGRQHNTAQARSVLERARRQFPRLSFDLIYARPGQTLGAWQRELDEALDLCADHLALYQLTIEPGTAFERAFGRGAFKLPTDETATALYKATAEACARHGLHPYEVSNYARPGQESLHNLTYWRYGPYLGIGAGAHSRVRYQPKRGSQQASPLTAIMRPRVPEQWRRQVQQQGASMAEQEQLSPQDCAREALLMGLRLREGIQAERFKRHTGQDLWQSVEQAFMEEAVAAGWLVAGPEGLRATAAGRLRLDAILPSLVA